MTHGIASRMTIFPAVGASERMTAYDATTANQEPASTPQTLRSTE